MHQLQPTQSDKVEFEPRSRLHGAAQGLWITIIELIAAALTVLLGFTAGLLIPPAPDDPNPGFSYLDYLAYGVFAAPAAAAITAVIVARRLRLGIPVYYLIPMGVPIGIAVAAHEVTAVWFAPLVLLLPVGNVALGAAFPGHRTEPPASETTGR
jgi:hypothetical protein